MGVDHSRALVRIAFDGLIVFCFNGAKSLCEAGMIKDGNHHRNITITEILPSGDRRPVRLKEPGQYEIDPTKDVEISAVNAIPSTHPIMTYHTTDPASPFNRFNDTGDPEDFRWVTDLEGTEFHGRKLQPKRDGFKSTLRLSHGAFYTLKKTRRFFGRRIIAGPGAGNPPEFMGKLAHNVGIDIVCAEDSGRVIIKNKGASSQLELPRPVGDNGDVFGSTYEILIENSCEPTFGRPGDFPLVYGALSDPSGVKYDLVVAVPAGHSLDRGGEAFANKPEFRLDGEPQVCNTGFLGISETLET